MARRCHQNLYQRVFSTRDHRFLDSLCTPAGPVDVLPVHTIPVLLLEPSIAEGRPESSHVVLVGPVFNRLWEGHWGGRVSRGVVASNGGTPVLALSRTVR